jgi:thioredoxin-related protein
MKKVLLGGLLLVFASLGLYSFVIKPGKISSAAKETVAVATIKWMTWDEAIAANKKVPKKMFVDCYTDWCGWCKRMDASTFIDPKVAEVMNKHFYAVKFDAEQRENVVFNGHTFKFIESNGRGVHELAYALLDGQLGYPSFVFLDEKQARIAVSPGYKTAEQMIPELQWAGEGHFTKVSLDDFKKGKK